MVGPVRGVKVTVERGVRRGVELMKMFNSVAEGVDGTEGGVTGHAVSKGLTTHVFWLV